MKDREQKLGRPEVDPSKARKAALGLATFSLLASACTSEAEPTRSPTPFNTEPVSTEVLPSETPLPTPTAEPTPTPEPSPTPTEVPMYIGFPADQMTTLREQCLQDNPDSLCLPLPVSPVGQDLQLREVSEVTLDVDTSEGRLRIEDFYLELPLPFGSTVRSLGDGEVRVFASHPDSLGIWGDPVKAGRNLTKFDWLIFQQGPFQDVYPDLALTVRKADGSKFSPEDLVLLVGDRQDVSRYQSLVTVGGMDLVLRIYRYGPLHTVAGVPVSESRVALRDLLRNDAGSIVYALPPLGEVWKEAEAYAYAKANCKPVDVGRSDAALLGYAGELLRQAGLPPLDSQPSANLGIYPLEGCVVVYYAPSEEQSFLVFETANGIQVIRQEPLTFEISGYGQ